MNRTLQLLVFLAGLAGIAWVGAGYVGTNVLALAVTALIAALYATGALELRRFARDTAALDQAVAALDSPPATLAPWLDGLPASLRSAVRRRVEGVPAALPGPALAPSLAGLLVLLGMLGTFLGMVLTLRGTGALLELSTDLSAVRDALVTPVKGLGLAFGTSIAGVAGSAALGLLSALLRRERLAAVQRLDAAIAGPLHGFSAAAQRETSLQLMQQQTALMPALVERLQALVDGLDRRSQEQQTQLQAGQAEFHARAEAAYTGLARSVEQSLQQSLDRAWPKRPRHQRHPGPGGGEHPGRHRPRGPGPAADAGRRRADPAGPAGPGLRGQPGPRGRGLAGRAGRAGPRPPGPGRDPGPDLQGFSQQFEARAEALVSALAAQQQQGQAGQLAQWQAQMDQAREAQQAAAQRFEQQAAALVERLAQAQATLADEARQRDAAQLAEVQRSLQTLSERLHSTWTEAGQQALAQQQQVGQALEGAATRFEAHAATLVAGIQQAQAALETAAGERDAARLSAITQALDGVSAQLRQHWTEAGAQNLAQQQQICETLARTAQEISAQAEAHARSTVGEVARLVDTAAQAPRAAAEVIAELRQQLSASMARDNAQLDERARLLQTLDTLLGAVTQAAQEQRGAIDALVASSAQTLETAITRFSETLAAQAHPLGEVAAQLSTGAVEVASLGEAFGQAVQLFTQSSGQLAGQLERIEAALGQSLARSDEQLAYYVAQAREVIDLSILSQKQILDDLQRIAERSTQAAERVEGAAA
jgi:hypothetical protein